MTDKIAEQPIPKQEEGDQPMTRSYTPSQIADGLLSGEFTRDSAFVPRAEVERLRAERDTLLLDARDFLRWFNRNYPDPSGHPDHPWCAINLRLNAHVDTLSALDSGLGAEP